MSARETFETATGTAPTFAGARLAYITTIDERKARDLGIIPSEIKIPEGLKLYALHAADGTTLAVMDSRDAAYGAALENELIPLSVH